MELEQKADTVRQLILRLNSNLDDGIHHNLKQNFSNLRYFIESPLFQRLCRIQGSLDQLTTLSKSYNLDSNDFDIDFYQGSLQLHQDVENFNQTKEKKSNELVNIESQTTTSFTTGADENLSQYSFQVLNNGTVDVEKNFNRRSVEKVILHRGLNETLGLSIKQEGEPCGFFIDSIQPGGIADRNGHLKKGDQILAINERKIDASMTNKDIIELLQKSNNLIELIVAKSELNAAFELPHEQHTELAQGNEEKKEKEENDEDNKNDKNDVIEILIIDLVNDGNGLGFGIVKKPTESGVVIKTVLPGRAAEKEGRLKTGDHILMIENQVVKDMDTKDVANILKKLGINVRLVVGRPHSEHSKTSAENKNLVYSSQLSDVLNTMSDEFLSRVDHLETLESTQFPNEFVKEKEEDNEKCYHVDLYRGAGGLGMTLDAFKEDNSTNGFMKFIVSEIVPGEVVDRDGKIQTGDHILEVNGTPLKVLTHSQATLVLKNCGPNVKLKMVRNPNISVGISETKGFEMNGVPMAGKPVKPARSISLKEDEQTNILTKQDSGESNGSSGGDEMINQLQDYWKKIIGQEYDIIVAKIVKTEKNGSLGISLDSRMKQTSSDHRGGDDGDDDTEYFHYLHSIIADKPVAREGSFQPGDRLLQVDQHSLINFSHEQVVSVIKQLGTHICMVCSRLNTKPKNMPQPAQNFPNELILGNNSVSTAKSYMMNEKFENQLQSTNFNGFNANSSPFNASLIESKNVSTEKLQATSNVELAGHNGLVLQKSVKNIAVIEPKIATVNPRYSNNYQQNLNRYLLQDNVSISNYKNPTSLLLAPVPINNLENIHAKNTIVDSGNSGENVTRDYLLPTAKVNSKLSSTLSNSFLDDSSTSETFRQIFASGWHPTPVFVDLMKEDQGLGFGLIDFENPHDHSNSIIVIRSLIPGSTADVEGQLKPGDRLFSVNNIPALQSNLDDAVQLLKTAPRGPIRIGVLKPIQIFDQTSQDLTFTKENSLDSSVLSPPSGFSSTNMSFSSTFNDKQLLKQNNFDEGLGRKVPPMNFDPSMYSLKTNSTSASNNNTKPFELPPAYSTRNNISSVAAAEINNGNLSKSDDAHQRNKNLNGVVTSKRDSERIASEKVEEIFQQHFPKHAIPAELNVNREQLGAFKPEPRLVDIHRENKESLGISIVGGRTINNVSQGIIIKNVNENGPAAKKLKSGDQILEVNGINCRNLTHEQVVEIIKNSSNPIWFYVQNNYGDNVDESRRMEMTFENNEAEEIEQRYGHLTGDLMSFDIDLGQPKSNLGLILAGNKNLDQMNTFVAAVQGGSAADYDGRIRPGDELLEINNQVLHERSHLNSSFIIKSLKTPVVHIVLLRNPENLNKIALNPKSPLPSPKFQNKPRLSLGAVGLHNDSSSSNNTFLSVENSEGLKKTKSAEYLAVPLSVGNSLFSDTNNQNANSKTSSLESLNKNFYFSSEPTKDGSDLPKNLAVKVTNGEQTSIKSETSSPKHADNLMAIELMRENGGLGISIIGGNDTLLGSIVVSDISKNGAADKDGRLKIGDVIVKVNNASLESVSRETAMKHLKQGPMKVILSVSRPPEDSVAMEEHYETMNVDLNKKPGQNLGITIIGRHHDSSIYVCELLKGGLAEADGKLKPGDEILSINKKTFKGQEAAAELLKSSMGMVRLTVRRLRPKKTSGMYGGMMAGVPEKLQKRPSTADVIKVELSRFDRGFVMFVLERDSAYIDEGSPIIIKEVKGQEAICKKFQVNDRILSINEESTDSMSINQAIQTIQKAPDSISFEILRGARQENITAKKSLMKTDERNSQGRNRSIEDGQIKIVTLHKEAGGYGFSIVGGYGSPQGNLPIYVRNVYEGSVAALDGRLKRGDKLVAVNGESLDGLSHHEAVSMLKQCEGTIVLTVIE